MMLHEIIAIVLAFALGAAVGALWGLSRHVELLDWLAARTISRWQRAMRSLGYKQEDIDMVLEKMGRRIMPPYIPCPEPPKEKSVEELLWEKNIGVIYCEELMSDSELIMEICMDYADKINEAAGEPDGFLFSVLEDRMRDELLQRSGHKFDTRPMVSIKWDHRDDHKYIQVMFDVVKFNAGRL